jgi:hypothetical protein
MHLVGLCEPDWNLSTHTLQIGGETIRNMAQSRIGGCIDQNTHRLMVLDQRQASSTAM